MAITAGIATVVVGGYSAYNSKKSADKLASLGKTQASRQAYFAQQLVDLMKDPSTILKDPGYQQSFSQGIQAVERSSAAKGFTGSGNAAIALQDYGQSFSSKYLREQQSLLASMSGGSFNPASAYAGAAQAQDQSFNQLGSVLASLGYTFGGSGTGAGSGSSSGSGLGGGYESLGGDNYSTSSGYIVNMPGSSGSGSGSGSSGSGP